MRLLRAYYVTLGVRKIVQPMRGVCASSPSPSLCCCNISAKIIYTKWREVIPTRICCRVGYGLGVHPGQYTVSTSRLYCTIIIHVISYCIFKRIIICIYSPSLSSFPSLTPSLSLCCLIVTPFFLSWGGSGYTQNCIIQNTLLYTPSLSDSPWLKFTQPALPNWLYSTFKGSALTYPGVWSGGAILLLLWAGPHLHR